MHQKIRVALVVAVLSVLVSGTARADSDGYYCAGPGYLAYQFGLAAPPVAPHRLYVVRFGGPDGIQPPVLFDLPQFQVHGLECTASAVRLAAFDRIYEVTLDTSVRPVALSAVERPASGQLPSGFIRPSQNLGSLSKPVATLQPERVLLLEKPNGERTLLQITGRPAAARCVTEITTRLVQVDAGGVEIRELILFTGQGHRECSGRRLAVEGRRPF